jgi:hypothetical protein
MKLIPSAGKAKLRAIQKRKQLKRTSKVRCRYYAVEKFLMMFTCQMVSEMNSYSYVLSEATS